VREWLCYEKVVVTPLNDDLCEPPAANGHLKEGRWNINFFRSDDQANSPFNTLMTLTLLSSRAIERTRKMRLQI
jgi:hypothetical protein